MVRLVNAVKGSDEFFIKVSRITQRVPCAKAADEASFVLRIMCLDGCSGEFIHVPNWVLYRVACRTYWSFRSYEHQRETSGMDKHTKCFNSLVDFITEGPDYDDVILQVVNDLQSYFGEMEFKMAVMLYVKDEKRPGLYYGGAWNSITGGIRKMFETTFDTLDPTSDFLLFNEKLGGPSNSSDCVVHDDMSRDH